MVEETFENFSNVIEVEEGARGVPFLVVIMMMMLLRAMLILIMMEVILLMVVMRLSRCIHRGMGRDLTWLLVCV